MKYINEFLRKKKPETFMDYAPGEVPKKTEKTSVGDGILDVPHFHTDSMESYKPRRGGVPSPPALFPYDYGRAQRPSPTNSNDGNHIAITNENNSSNPYGSPVKIVGDNVTKKDYDDFWNAFHEESTGEKLNWAANQMQPKPQKQTTPQNRNSRNMMHWAMQ